MGIVSEVGVQAVKKEYDAARLFGDLPPIGVELNGIAILSNSEIEEIEFRKNQALKGARSSVLLMGLGILDEGVLVVIHKKYNEYF